MAVKDLREWIEKVEAMGQLQRVNGADWNLEIGVISEIWGTDAPALLFDNIKGYPSGYRVLTHSCSSPERISFTIDMKPISNKLELVKECRKKLSNLKLIPPKVVKKGPVKENILKGKNIDMWKFPTPKWHEHDGGRFIGTGCLAITRDPDTGWVNFGAYRVMIHDKNTAGVFITLGKHGRIMMQKYWDRGKPCPIAVSFGHDPLLFLFSGVEVHHEVSEYAIAGGVRRKPVEVIEGEVTGLPIPATAEIAIEGEVKPNETKIEGPFGEWTGYYAGGALQKPFIRIKSLMHRDNPIILGSAPGKTPSDNTYFLSPIKSAAIWDEIDKAGVPGVQGVWSHEAGGGRLMLIVSIKQLYPGHAKQAALVASQCHQGAYSNRYVIVVDDDINPTDINEVLWAMCTRVDVKRDIEIIDRCWTSPIDPMHYPVEEMVNVFNSRMIIDACIPWERINNFPKVAESSEDLKKKIVLKWKELFNKFPKK